mgnify:CR=1 FL=1
MQWLRNSLTRWFLKLGLLAIRPSHPNRTFWLSTSIASWAELLISGRMLRPIPIWRQRNSLSNPIPTASYNLFLSEEYSLWAWKRHPAGTGIRCTKERDHSKYSSSSTHRRRSTGLTCRSMGSSFATPTPRDW